MTATGIGAPVRRKEDLRFITGKGSYTDDFNRPGQAHAYFLRSPHAHANIRSIDLEAARAMPGVVAVLTGDDLAADKIGGLICGWMIHSKDGTPMKAGPHPALAQGKVRYVGDHVAVVIAETLAQASDAAEAIAVDYEVLPAVVDVPRGADRRRPQVHEVAPDNTVFRLASRRQGRDRRRLSPRPSTSPSSIIVNNRLVPNAMEPRAAVGDYDAGTDNYTLYTTSQNPHVARLVLSAFIGIAPEHKLRVIAPGCRRRLRLEDLHLCRGDGLRLGGQEGRPSGEMDVRSHRGVPRRRAWPRPRHPRRDWPSTRTARSWACGSRPSPISAPTCRPSRPRCRPTSTRRCCPGSTTFRRSTARSTPSIPTPRRSTPIAARAGRRRPSCVERSSRWRRASSARIRPSSASATSSRSSRTRRRSS